MHLVGCAQWKAGSLSAEATALFDTDLCSCRPGQPFHNDFCYHRWAQRGDGGLFCFLFLIDDHNFPSSLFWKVSGLHLQDNYVAEMKVRDCFLFPRTSKQHLLLDISWVLSHCLSLDLNYHELKRHRISPRSMKHFPICHGSITPPQGAHIWRSWSTAILQW